MQSLQVYKASQTFEYFGVTNAFISSDYVLVRRICASCSRRSMHIQQKFVVAYWVRLASLASKRSPESHNLLPISLWKHVDLSLGKLHDRSHQSIRILAHSWRSCCRWCRRWRNITRIICRRRCVRHGGDRWCVIRDRDARISSNGSRWVVGGGWRWRVRVYHRLDSLGRHETHQK